jgi:hypothetical protein
MQLSSEISKSSELIILCFIDKAIIRNNILIKQDKMYQQLY